MFIKNFKQLSKSDVAIAGGKGASLGEMTRIGLQVPPGFVVLAAAFDKFLAATDLGVEIAATLKKTKYKEMDSVEEASEKIRDMIADTKFPEDLGQKILADFKQLKASLVAVRSSATAEGLPGASFAGGHETYLNIRGEKVLLEATKKCFASLFTDRAISYRVDKGFDQMSVALSVGVQKMVRSDKAVSGVAFTIDTETGFSNAVVIDSVYGLGEMIVQGKVDPDEFIVFKPSLANGKYPIINKKLADKNVKMIYSSTALGTSASAGINKKPVKIVPVPESQRKSFSLTDKEVISLAQDCIKVEKHFSKKHGKYMPMDLEWAKDGLTNELFVVQARPETIHAGKKETVFEEYSLISRPQKSLISGIPIGKEIVSGKVRVIKSVKDIHTFKPGEVLVTEITDPDWEPIMKIASAIVTDKGGRTSHAAIVSRELGVQCIVGSGDATRVLKTGQTVTVDCSSDEAGRVYSGVLKFKIQKHSLKNLPKIYSLPPLSIP